MSGSTPKPEIQGQREKPLLKKWKFMAALNADPELSGSSKSVALALMDILNNEDGYARPGHPYIAKRAGTNVTAVKRGIKELQRRGWFVVEPAYSSVGDRDANRYFPVWKRATTGTPPAESERKRKVRRAPLAKPDLPSFAFENGPVRLTTTEVERLEGILGPLAVPFFHELRTTEFREGNEGWRDEIEDMVNIWLEPSPELVEEPF